MRKTLYATVMLFAMVALVGGIGGAADTMNHGQGIAKVKLSAIPATKAKDSGEADFRLSEDGATIHYVLRGRDVVDATMGHIHEVGPGGGPGAIIAWLYPTAGDAPALKPGKTTGILAEGTLDAAKLKGPLKGKTVKELYEMIGHGKAGVAVHTKANPGGELWGVAGGERHSMDGSHPKTAGY